MAFYRSAWTAAALEEAASGDPQKQGYDYSRVYGSNLFEARARLTTMPEERRNGQPDGGWVAEQRGQGGAPQGARVGCVQLLIGRKLAGSAAQSTASASPLRRAVQAEPLEHGGANAEREILGCSETTDTQSQRVPAPQSPSPPSSPFSSGSSSPEEAPPLIALVSNAARAAQGTRVRRRSHRVPRGREAKTDAQLQREREDRIEKRLCKVCRTSGASDLIVCDSCSQTYHRYLSACLPPELAKPQQRHSLLQSGWLCPECLVANHGTEAGPAAIQFSAQIKLAQVCVCVCVYENV
jgi:hypothetical protein